MRFAIIRFPGTWSDLDCYHVLHNVLDQPADYGWRRGHDVGTDLGRLQHMDAMPHRGDQDFGRIGIIVIDQPNVGDQRHAVEAVVVMPPYEGRNECRSALAASSA